MKGSEHYIGLKIGEIKSHLQRENHVKAYQSLLDLEEEFYEQNKEIEDIDVSDFFARERVEEMRETVKEARENDIPPKSERLKKARLVVGYINDE